MGERDYVLGTHDEEIARLGLQHRIWQQEMLSCWSTAMSALQQFGKTGKTLRALDVGSGPGYATKDLGAVLGKESDVIGLERSERFIQSARDRCADQANVSFRELDLVNDELDVTEVDLAWCRWVLAFVADPARVVTKIAKALHPGGVFAIHDYCDYRSWRLAPPHPILEEFVSETMDSWRDTGGDPNIGLRLPTMLSEAGLEVVHVRPIIKVFSPDEDGWRWPEAFIINHAPRLVELRGKSHEWAEAVMADLRGAEQDPRSLMITPMVLEIVAVRT